jgi:DNA polymerase II large subunit
MSNNKHSSIDLMFNRAISVLPIDAFYGRQRLKETYEQAKEMHKEEIEDAFQSGKWDWAEHIVNDVESKDTSQYYNETFNPKEK